MTETHQKTKTNTYFFKIVQYYPKVNAVTKIKPVDKAVFIFPVIKDQNYKLGVPCLLLTSFVQSMPHLAVV